MSGVPIAPPVVHYPESDGAPLAETPTHLRAIVDLLGAFDQLFQDRDDVFVAADIFLYDEEGNPRAVRAPDVLVAKGSTSGPIGGRSRPGSRGRSPA